ASAVQRTSAHPRTPHTLHISQSHALTHTSHPPDPTTIPGHLHPRTRYPPFLRKHALPPALRNLEKSHHALQDRHFRLSAPRHARVSRKIQASLDFSCGGFWGGLGWLGPMLAGLWGLIVLGGDEGSAGVARWAGFPGPKGLSGRLNS